MSKPGKLVLAEGERLGIVGGGTMVKALVFPLLEKGLLQPDRVIVSARTEATLAPWKQRGCHVTTDNTVVTSTSDIVIWGVKPQMFKTAVPDRWNVTREGCTKTSSLHLSVLAGLKVDDFRKRLQDSLEAPSGTAYELRCIRTMPNIGAKVGCGCVVYTVASPAQQCDREFAHRFFGPTGLCFEAATESQINAYSALFGSGIGFMFPILEAMADGAVKMGIPRAQALRLAAQTMKGAGELLLKEERHPGALKDEVCSPGGSTIAGIAAMEKHGVRYGMIAAIEDTTKRNEELGNLK